MYSLRNKVSLIASGSFIILILVFLFLFACEKIEPERKIKLTTGTITNISYISCSVQGTILDVGSKGIDQHGFCWAETQNPTTDNFKTQLGSKSSTGKFSGNLTGLLANTSYYVRAYAQNRDGISYGDQKSFSTLAYSLPTVTTTSVSNRTVNSAQSGGNIADDGGATVTARGVCWSTSQNPTISNDHTTNGSGTGSFTSSITGLTPNRLYYVRAYATNSLGTVYGNEIVFSPLSLPSVATHTITNITENSAESGGSFYYGGDYPSALGVCWSTSQIPNISDNHTTDNLEGGYDNGNFYFSSLITDLSPGTTYYVRAYATNSVGTAYGNERSFTTGQTIVSPTVTTNSATDIAETSATVGGEVTADGGATVTARGVCWSTTSNPSTADSKTTDGSGTGSFTSSLSGLSASTIYYVRAYATNSEGTAYGNEISFQSWDGLLSDYDGNSYSTIEIGNQVWMAENLKVTHYSDGNAISLVEGTSAWDALSYTDKAYCYYNNLTTNKDIYGALYTWAAAMNGAASSSANPSGIQGVCPTGWHLPGDAEWKELEMHLGMSQADADATGWRGTDEGAKLKESGTTHWTSPNTGATNESGFTALPGGRRYNDGSFSNLGYYAYFWSATEGGSSYAWGRYLNCSNSGVGRGNDYKNSGFSVRCLKD